MWAGSVWVYRFGMALGNQEKFGDSFELTVFELEHKKICEPSSKAKKKQRVWLHFHDSDLYEYSWRYGQKCHQMIWFILLSITFKRISSCYSSIETNHLSLIKAIFFGKASFPGLNIVLFCRHQEIKKPSVLLALTD